MTVTKRFLSSGLRPAALLLLRLNLVVGNFPFFHGLLVWCCPRAEIWSCLGCPEQSAGSRCSWKTWFIGMRSQSGDVGLVGVLGVSLVCWVLLVELHGSGASQGTPVCSPISCFATR